MISRQRLFALALAASVLAALPGVRPLALARTPLAAGNADAWYAHHDPAAPLAVAAQRADHVSARPSRNAIGDRHAAAAVVFSLTILAAIGAVDDRVVGIARLNPTAGRDPPRLLSL